MKYLILNTIALAMIITGIFMARPKIGADGEIQTGSTYVGSLLIYIGSGLLVTGNIALLIFDAGKGAKS